MRAGDLSNLLEVQSVTRAADGYGGWTETWTTDERAWGAIEPTNPREFFFAGGTLAGVTHRVRLRAPSAVKSGSRLILGTRTLRVVARRDLRERGRELELLCEEEVS